MAVAPPIELFRQHVLCIIENGRFMVGINAILAWMLREISSGWLAMLHLGPIRDFQGLVVGHGPARVSNLPGPITLVRGPLRRSANCATI